MCPASIISKMVIIKKEMETQIDIKSRLKDFIFKPDDYLLIHHILKNQIKKGSVQDFTDVELGWLSFNFNVLPKLIKSEVGSSIFYMLYNYKSSNIHEASRRMGLYTSTVRYWIRKLTKANIIDNEEIELRNSLTMWEGNEIKYFLNTKKYPNIMNFMFESIKEMYGVQKLNERISVHKDKQQESIMKSRKKQHWI